MASITSRPAPSNDFDELRAQRLHEAAERIRLEEEHEQRPSRRPVLIVKSDNIDLNSLFMLNDGAASVFGGARWGLGDVDPETVDLSPDALADYRAENSQPLPPLKTETAWPPRDVVAFRSKRK
jgi:hypothetical protein